MEKFYLVWEPRSGYTRYQHESKESAVAEAERLACLEEDKEFFVLEPVSVSQRMKPVSTAFFPADEPPF